MRWLIAVSMLVLIRPHIGAAQPLHDAVVNGDVAAVEKLLADGADVDEKTYNDFRPLDLAKDPAVVKALLRYHPKLNETASGGTPLQAATEEVARGGEGADQSRKITRLLLDAGAEYDIISAIHLNDRDRVWEILRKNPKAAIGPEDDLQSPLRVAASEGRVEICKLLLANKADPEDVERGCGYSILKDAVKYPEVVKILLAAGVDVNRRLTWRGGRSGGWLVGDDATVLHFAAADGVPETIRLLIDHGADVLATAHDTGEKHGHQIPLDVAAQSGKLQNALVLLDARRFRDLDKSHRCPILNRCMLESLIPPFESDKQSADRPALVEAFLKSGANPNASLKGVPAIQIAAK